MLVAGGRTVQGQAPIVGGKGAYLNRIRAESAYPFFRGVISFFMVVGYMLSIVAIFSGLGMIYKGFMWPGIGVIAAGVVLGIATAAGSEVSLMLADIADSHIDGACSRKAESLA